jgi:fructose-bisphosphate aldolase class I
MLLETPNLGDYISGVILFEESLTHTTANGTSLPQLAAQQGIVAGIKVDKGFLPLAGAAGDNITQGLDGLAERLAIYKQQGARFAKWREVYAISATNPTLLGIEANAETLARYAAICQSVDMVPIVEPEVLLDGAHSIDRCYEVIEAVQHAVFHALYRHGVIFECMLLKPSMVIQGKDHPTKATPQEIAEKTLKELRRTVPAAVPSINFLSGGQSPAEATANLNAINSMAGNTPWLLSFSYARALQEPVLQSWAGQSENVTAAQTALYKRAKLNGAAQSGQYSSDMENR